MVFSAQDAQPMIQVACLMYNSTKCLALHACPGVCCVYRSKQEFRRVILRYSPSGEALSLTEEVYKPAGHRQS